MAVGEDGVKIISLLAQKGGTGKSTLVAHLAVEACRTAPKPVVLIDLDPQASLRRWYEKREDEQPVMVDLGRDNLGHLLDACRRDGVGLVIIDTAPHALEQAAAAATAADLVVIPTRPGVMDIEAIDATVDIVNGVNATGVIVINATRPRGTMTDEARQALEIYELPICPTAIVQRAALVDALIDGRGVQELDAKGKAADETGAVWNWIKRRI
jgi:chromosome partitioning protein